MTPPAIDEDHEAPTRPTRLRPPLSEEAALAQLRHLYQQMVQGRVRGIARVANAARGLLGPAIEAFETAHSARQVHREHDSQ